MKAQQILNKYFENTPICADDFHSSHPDRLSQLHLPPGINISFAGAGQRTEVTIHGITCYPVIAVRTALGGGAI